MSVPNANVVQRCIQLCSDYFEQLMGGGVDEQVALDRTYDCYEKALEQSEEHCFDKRDQLFELKLRTIVQRGFAS
ncbi:MAG: hypothetical protein IJJ14_07045 [Coriobacteriales bacterium]|nr:hypothetical protein [Coriobacteriales bacterium]